ncbi:MAG: hypothetical protein PVI30_22435 [Myxococcales bacterium]|jgi:hypothetical protein
MADAHVDGPCRLYLTYRSEYLVLRDLCVGVRDRATGAWVPLHAASCAHLIGPLAEGAHDPCGAPSAKVGERLSLYAAARRVTTGPVIAVERVGPELLREADRRWRELFGPRDRRHSMITLG